MFYASSPIDTGVRSSLIDSAMPCLVCRGLPGGESLSFASPKESNQRKGDPQSGSLRFASGNFRCSKPAEFLETSLLRSRRTSKNFDPLPPALLSPARTGVGMESDSGMPSPLPSPRGRGRKSEFTPHPVLAGLEKAGGDGLKNLDVRRRQSRLVSRFSGSFSFFKAPRSGSDCGSPFLLLTLLLAKQKKSELLPGNPRQTTLGESTLKKAQWQQEASK